MIINNHYIEFPWELWMLFLLWSIIIWLWSNNFISFACMNLHIIHAKRKWKHKHDTYERCEKTKYEELNQWHRLQNTKWLYSRLLRWWTILDFPVVRDRHVIDNAYVYLILSKVGFTSSWNCEMWWHGCYIRQFAIVQIILNGWCENEVVIIFKSRSSW